MIPSAAIACLFWLKAKHPTKVRAWWKILSRSWVLFCVTQILIVDGAVMVCQICGNYTVCQ